MPHMEGTIAGRLCLSAKSIPTSPAVPPFLPDPHAKVDKARPRSERYRHAGSALRRTRPLTRVAKMHRSGASALVVVQIEVGIRAVT